MDPERPLPEVDLRAFHHGPGVDGEVLVAGSAAPAHRLAGLHLATSEPSQ